MLVTFAALVAAIMWNLLTWKFGIPSSSSHALIGGLVGAGMGVGGVDVITWSSAGTVLIAIVASPAVAFTLACLAMLLIVWIRKCSPKLTEDATVFRVLQILATCWLSWAHGSNDAQKTMGVLAATLYAAGYLDAPNAASLVPPLWVVLAAHGAIGCGTLFGGWAIIETMGMNITLITRASGCAANLGTIIAIEAATLLGVPVSTTQAAAAAVTGSGFAARRSLGWTTLKTMCLAWVITLPCSLCIGAIIVQMARVPDPYDLVVGGTILVILLMWGAYLALEAKSMKDVQDRLPSDQSLATGEDKDIRSSDMPHLYGSTEQSATNPSSWSKFCMSLGRRRKIEDMPFVDNKDPNPQPTSF